jgi:predicted HicB family RNase H-like nuclease
VKEKNTTFLLRLPPKLKSRLEEAAKRDDRSMSNFVVRLIEAACTKAEEQANKPLEDRNNA